METSYREKMYKNKGSKLNNPIVIDAIRSIRWLNKLFFYN